jgi:hypothetical protein
MKPTVKSYMSAFARYICYSKIFKTRRCFITIAFQICFRICQEELKVKGIEGIVAFKNREKWQKMGVYVCICMIKYKEKWE